MERRRVELRATLAPSATPGDLRAPNRTIDRDCSRSLTYHRGSMKKGAPKRQKKRKLPNVIVPASPFGFEETVKRLLRVKPLKGARSKTRLVI